MRKLGISFVLGLVAVVSAVQTPAQSAVPVTLIKASRLLDPRTGNVLSPAAVLIEDGKIKEVGSLSQLQAHAPAGVKTVDLGRATLFPGSSTATLTCLWTLLCRRKSSVHAGTTAILCRGCCWRLPNRPASGC